ncbi:MAG: chorismate synthase [Bdellovibrio sp.]|nr:chorismate synthase [Bdellovibrio sp.]
MRGNLFGKMLSIVSFGESHGPAIGVVVDGVPSGLAFSQSDLQRELDRRAPGRVVGTTARQEADVAEVLSGVFEGKTLGSPIAVIVRNTSQKSQDYDKLKNEIRPGHADQTYLDKYGIRDHRGGGRASGRETIARVIGGYFASLVLPKVVVRAMTMKLGNFEWKYNPGVNLKEDFGPYGFPDNAQTEAIATYLLGLKSQGNSVGGKACIVVDNCPAGLGEPAFDKLKADLSKALLSIGSIVSFSYGLGEEMAEVSGQAVSSDRGNFGGIEGGISNGERIFMQVTFKPTSTVGEHAQKGRHDPCIIPRALPVVESMVKIVLADHFLRQRAYSK